MSGKENRDSVTLTKLTPLNGDLHQADKAVDNTSHSHRESNGNTDVSGVPAVKYQVGNGNSKASDLDTNAQEKKNGLFGCCGSKDTKPDEDRVGVLELFRFASTFDRLLMVIGLFGAVILGCAIPTNMAVFGEVINTFITTNGTESEDGSSSYDNIVEEMLPNIFFFIGIAVAALISGFVSIFCLQLTAERQVNTMRIKFFQSVMKQNIGWFDVHEAGEISSHFSEDIAKIGEGIGDKLAVFVQWTSTWAAAYVMAFTRAWQLTLSIAIFSPVIVFLGGVILRVMRNFSIKEFKAYAKAGSVADQAFRAIRTVQAFQGQEKEAERYNSNLANAVNVASRKGIALGMGQSALWFIVFILFAMVMWLGILFIQHLDIPPGNVVPVFLGVMIGSISLGNASNNLENFSTARGAASKVFSMIGLVPEIDGTSDKGLKPKELKGHIKLENIHFSYPARPDVKVLNGFSLEIEPGKHIALVGSSGCGKSTVVQLVQRFYDPHDGRILFDGQDLKDINLKWLREKIGIVSQEPVLFDMTIADNIKFGKLDASQKEIEQAAMDANAHDFIKLLPQGYDTNVGERGAQLSGGQKQRIAIARALIRNPSILLLDEATSALDQESEAIVQNALNMAEKGRTTITIAHRLSTIKNADLIVSISEGQLIEMGTHKQLMESKGLYFELVQLQTRLEKEGELDAAEEITSHLSLRSSQSLSPARDIADVEIVEEDEDEHDVTQGLLRASFRRTDSVESKHSVKSITLVARSSKRVDTKAELKMKKKLLEEEDVKEVSLKTIVQYNTQEWHLILFGCLASLLGGSLHPCFSFLLSEFIKVFGEEDKEKQMNQTHLLAGIVIGIAFLSALIRMAQGYCFCKSGAKLTARLRSLTFESLINQDMEYFDQPQNQVGSLTSKLASDAALVQGATGAKIGQVLEALSCLMCAVVIAFVFGWKLAFVVCAFLPLMIGAGIVQGIVIKGASKKDNVQLQEAGKICSEVLDNIRTVASLGREDYFFSRFETLINMNRKSNLKTSIVFGICYGIASSLIFFAYATAFYYGSTLVENGEMEFFNVFRVFAAIIFGGTMVGRQSSFGVDYAKAKMAASRIISLINRKPKVDVREKTGSKLNDFDGSLTVQGATFHYPMRPTVPVLNGMDLSIKPGETVALVGASGCGKSTLTQILQRFYELDGGSVFADSTDIRQVNLMWFRQQISIVSQEPTLFDCSIAENIAYGDNTRVVAMDEIIQAAKDANIHSFISALPQGYETNVGSKGTQLSGGQKQRIAIARALIRNPKILLLDEATSALDSESEKIVQEALDKAGTNRTCIIIAHRLSTIQNADKIAVVSKGKIVEMGSHAKLIAIKGAYYRLYSAQNRIVGI